MDGDITGIPSLLTRLQSESFPQRPRKKTTTRTGRDARSVKLADADANEFKQAVMQAFRDIANRYYLESDVECSVRVSGNSLNVSIPLEEIR